jgi:hypothetical protein
MRLRPAKADPPTDRISLSKTLRKTVEATMTYEEFKVWNDRKIATCHDEGNDHGVEVCMRTMRPNISPMRFVGVPQSAVATQSNAR